MCVLLLPLRRGELWEAAVIFRLLVSSAERNSARNVWSHSGEPSCKKNKKQNRTKKKKKKQYKELHDIPFELVTSYLVGAFVLSRSGTPHSTYFCCSKPKHLSSGSFQHLRHRCPTICFHAEKHRLARCQTLRDTRMQNSQRLIKRERESTNEEWRR